MAHHYERHVLRRPADQWPDPVNRAFKHLNPAVYVPMQGPSELGASGKLERWDRARDLPAIPAPTLVIGAGHDTMDPAHMRWMADQLPRGRYLHCPNGSHMALYDDQQAYFAGFSRSCPPSSLTSTTAKNDPSCSSCFSTLDWRSPVHNGVTH
jgi:proline iminopeptidase